MNTEPKARSDPEEEVRRLKREVSELRTALEEARTKAAEAAGTAANRSANRNSAIPTSTRHDDRFGAFASQPGTILSTVSMGIVYVRHRKFEWVNSHAAKLLGYAPHETVGMDVSEVYADQEDYLRIGAEAYRQFATGAPYSAELRLRKRDGSAFWGVLTGQAVDPSAPDEGSIWVTQDITARRQAEETLRTNEERLKRLLANSGGVTGVANREAQLTMFLGPVGSILGYGLTELLGSNAFTWFHPADLAAARQAFAELTAEAGAVRTLDCRLRHKNASWVTVEIVGTNLLDDPLVQGLVLNIRDVSERVKLQAQLEHAMKMEAVGRLAGGVAHDFNNLLTAVVGNAQLAQDELARGDPLIRYLEQISKAAYSAIGLTRQLLAFSRRQVIEPIVLDLNDLIRNLEPMMKRLIGEDITLQVGLEEELGTVRIDPGQFEQVLVNLVVNARDAMPDGGRLTIETRNVELDQYDCAAHPEVHPGKKVMLCVTDTGHGMTEEVKQHLFEPFFTTKPKERGTGLGLAVAFGAIKQAGGSIDVYSEPGRGTSLNIRLPRTVEAAQKLSALRPSRGGARGTETVLLVEDESLVREVVQGFLKRQGYTVLDAPNGAEALLLAQRHPARIDLLMTDVVMPGMNGCELSQQIRALHPEMKVLFTSGYTDDVTVQCGVLEQDLNFIGKPFSVRDLATKIREVLDRPE